MKTKETNKSPSGSYDAVKTVIGQATKIASAFVKKPKVVRNETVNKKDGTNPVFDFEDYLDNKNWEEDEKGIFRHGTKSIKFINSGKMMIALDFNKSVKHKHIVTCLTPRDKNEADILFDLTNLND